MDTLPHTITHRDDWCTHRASFLDSLKRPFPRNPDKLKFISNEDRDNRSLKFQTLFEPVIGTLNNRYLDKNHHQAVITGFKRSGDKLILKIVLPYNDSTNIHPRLTFRFNNEDFYITAEKPKNCNSIEESLVIFATLDLPDHHPQFIQLLEQSISNLEYKPAMAQDDKETAFISISVLALVGLISTLLLRAASNHQEDELNRFCQDLSANVSIDQERLNRFVRVGSHQSDHLNSEEVQSINRLCNDFGIKFNEIDLNNKKITP